jgi:hypothetical protein
MYCDDKNEAKRKVNLVRLAASYGYEIDKGESGPGSIKMRRGTDIIVCRQESDGWKFFSPRDTSNPLGRGDIITFVRRERGCDFPAALAELKSFASTQPAAAEPVLAQIQAPRLTAHDRPAPIDEAWRLLRFVPDDQHTYDYLKSRGILDGSYNSPELMRADARHNACFAHRDEDNRVVGWEVKNRNFAGFSAGGTKALFYDRPLRPQSRVVVCESAIDALSAARLEEKRDYKAYANTAYVSVAGDFGPHQVERLKALGAAGKTIDLCLDRDVEGDRMTARLKAEIPDGRDIRSQLVRDGLKDPNDELQAGRAEAAKQTVAEQAREAAEKAQANEALGREKRRDNGVEF